ncbi:hypothetical protein ABZP36_008702 [Zizania latifolia]
MEKKKAKRLRKNDDHPPHSEPSASTIKRKRKRRKPRDPSPGSGSDSDCSPPSSPTSVRRLLEPYSKPHLLAFLADAASADPALLARLRAAADASPSHRRLFVHGLPPHADGPALAEAFSPLRLPRRLRRRRPPRHWAMQRERLHAFFARFGELEGGPFGFDAETGSSRGYALFVYRAAEGARKAVEEPYRIFEGRTLHCQLAVDPTRKSNAPSPAPAAVVPPPVAAPALQPVLDAAVASGVVDLAMYARNPAQAAALLGKNPILAAAVLSSALASTTAALSPSPAAASSLGPAALVARRLAAAPAMRPLLVAPPSPDTAAAVMPSPAKIVITRSGDTSVLFSHVMPHCCYYYPQKSKQLAKLEF